MRLAISLFAVQAMLLSRLANGLLGALSGCVGENIILIPSKTLQKLTIVSKKNFASLNTEVINIWMMVLQARDERKHSGHRWARPDWESCHAEAQTIRGWQVRFGLVWFGLVWFV